MTALAATLRAQATALRVQADALEALCDSLANAPAQPEQRQATPVDPDTLLSPRQVGELLGCSPAGVYRMLSDARLPSIVVGRLRRVRRADLAAFLEQRRIAPERPPRRRTKPLALVPEP